MSEADNTQNRIRTAQSMSEMRVRQIHEWFGVLTNALGGTEVVEYVCVASKDLLTGLLVVTDSRLLWVAKKHRSSIKLGSISSVSAEQGVVRSSVSRLVIQSLGVKYEFTDLESGCANDVVLLLERRDSGVVALAVPDVQVPAPKPIKPMGVAALFTTVATFTGGAFFGVPWLRDFEDLPLIGWPIAAAGLVFVAFLAGTMIDSATRVLMSGKRSGSD